jgi:hypothetical protein
VKVKHNITITLPDLSQQTAYEFVCWLEGLAHEVSCIYSDEIRSELQRRDNERERTAEEERIPF